MNESDMQDTLMNLIESLIDAREEIDGDDDDIELADITRDMASDLEDVVGVTTFERVQLLTGNKGLVLRTATGGEFQITIVQSR